MFKEFCKSKQNKIEAFENEFEIDLPKDYEKFLSKTNGGNFIDDIHYVWIEELEINIGIDVLFGLGHDKRGLNLDFWYQEYCDDLVEKSLIIGNSINAGLILMIWQEDWKGIFLWDHCLELEQSTEEDCLYRIANDFTSFFDKLGVEKM